jgi:hypothetical protein
MMKKLQRGNAFFGVLKVWTRGVDDIQKVISTHQVKNIMIYRNIKLKIS